MESINRVTSHERHGTLNYRQPAPLFVHQCFNIMMSAYQAMLQWTWRASPKRLMEVIYSKIVSWVFAYDDIMTCKLPLYWPFWMTSKAEQLRWICDACVSPMRNPPLYLSQNITIWWEIPLSIYAYRPFLGDFNVVLLDQFKGKIEHIRA